MVETNPSENAQRIEDARVAYQLAIGLVNLVSQELYSRFNPMLVANSILIGIIGVFCTKEQAFFVVKCWNEFGGHNT